MKGNEQARDPESRWTGLLARLKPMLRDLKECEPHKHRAKPALPEEPGVYLFSESDRDIYVGITRNLRSRYRQHTRPGAPENEASFAFSIAKRTANDAKFTNLDLPRKALATNQEFATNYFAVAKERVRAMDFRFVTMDEADPDADSLLTVFEVYASIELGTEGDFNLFRTH